MAYLRINHDKVSEETAEVLQEICPFHAITYENSKLEMTAACKMCRLCVKKGPQGVIEYIEDAAGGADKSKWKGIAVFVEHTEEGIHPVTLELIGKARELAEITKQEVYAVIMGFKVSKKAEELLHYGVNKVYIYDDRQLQYFCIFPYANAFEHFIRQVMPSSILVGATNLGRSLAPRVAARFRTGLTADCTELDMKENTDIVQIRPAFGGNIMAQIITPKNRPQFCTVRYKIFSSPDRTNLPSGEIVFMKLTSERLMSKTEVLDIKKGSKEASISEADVIIAVGRGIKSQSDLLVIEELADVLGAKIACTRPLIEAGWFQPKQQIGLSGRTVKAKLIITIGVSGSVQFVAGMRNSECIIAVNKDKDAPIFDVAHYGLVGDWYELVPMLLKQIKREGDSKYGLSSNF